MVFLKFIRLLFAYTDKLRDLCPKKDMNTLSYSEKNSICEGHFNSHGPFWHLYTNGQSMQNLFLTPENFKTGIFVLALSVCICNEVQLIAFELMSNHIHWILAGMQEKCLELFTTFRKRMKMTYARQGIVVDWDNFQAEILPIESLESLRNEIIYTHRNAYVASGNYNPFSYPWGSGCAYFNHWIGMVSTSEFSQMSLRTKREMTHCRDIAPFNRLQFADDTVYIPSFCNIRLGESMFVDPRSYFNMLTRKAEVYSSIAARLKDCIFLTDDEMFLVASSFCKENFRISTLAQLSPEQRIATARELHFKYNATNQQIRRLLRLEMTLLNEMFP